MLATSRRRAPALIVVLGLLGTAPAPAEEAKLSPALDKCLDKAAGVTAAMVDCIGAETAVQDKRLNAAYKAAIAKQTPARQKQLQSVQRLWLQ